MFPISLNINSQLLQGPASVLIDFSIMGVMIFNVGK